MESDITVNVAPPVVQLSLEEIRPSNIYQKAKSDGYVTQQSGVSLDVGDLKDNSSSTSIESKVESIYVGTMHNNHITINQHLRPGDEKDQKKTLIDTGQKRLGTRAMSLTISDTIPFGGGLECRCNISLILALSIIFGMTLMVVSLFDTVSTRIRIPIFAVGAVVMSVTSVLYCRHNQHLQEEIERAHPNKPKLMVTDVDGKTTKI